MLDCAVRKGRRKRILPKWNVCEVRRHDERLNLLGRENTFCCAEGIDWDVDSYWFKSGLCGCNKPPAPSTPEVKKNASVRGNQREFRDWIFLQFTNERPVHNSVSRPKHPLDVVVNLHGVVGPQVFVPVGIQRTAFCDSWGKVQEVVF